MLTDALCKLASSQAVSAAAYGDEAAFDLGNVTPKRRVGTGEALSMLVVVETAAAGDSGSFTDTFDFIAVQSANSNLSSHTEIIKRRIAGATLTAGYSFEIPIPQGTPTVRYLGIRFEPGSGDTVTVSAYLMRRADVEVSPKIHYAKGYSI